MKIILVLSVFCLCFLSQNKSCFAQSPAKIQSAKDSTLIENLDYHLSKTEFTYYYGKDDTAKAIINMFYRKRGMAGIDFALIPFLSSFLGSGLVLVGAVEALGEMAGAAATFIAAGLGVYAIGTVIVPVYFIVQRCIYTRQKLIYTLVGRERRKGIPVDILEALRDSDFR